MSLKQNDVYYESKKEFVEEKGKKLKVKREKDWFDSQHYSNAFHDNFPPVKI